MSTIFNAAAPFLTMLIGGLSLVADPKSPNRRYVFPILVVLLVLLGSGQIYSNFLADQEQEKFRRGTSQGLENIAEMLQRLQNRGFDLTEELTADRLIQSEKANQAIRLFEDRPTATVGRQTLVKYYPKVVDGKTISPETILSKLKSFGFDVEQRQPNVRDVPTNSVWYGENVDIADVKLISLTLVRAGMGIKQIKRFDNVGRKPNIVEIGAYTGIVHKPNLSVAEIQNL